MQYTPRSSINIIIERRHRPDTFLSLGTSRNLITVIQSLRFTGFPLGNRVITAVDVRTRVVHQYLYVMSVIIRVIIQYYDVTRSSWQNLNGTLALIIFIEKIKLIM